MKSLLRLEELAQLLFVILVLGMKGVAWWVYLLLFIGPDIGMLGYLVNTRVGAFTYNLTHHKGLAIILMLLGLIAEVGDMLTNVQSGFFIAGLIMYGHSSMDRMLGYGLKFGDHFQHTHLGWIGKFSHKEQAQ
ncbi:MAG: DUF4260 domain-containing protein [Flavobacteriales bacterium]|nr:DUF4260 domain-containing protein [Flavobacteriales bacterium]